jgi:adenosine deaminase
VNSDDPAYFGGYVAENYLAVSRALGLSRAEVTQLAANSIEASLLSPASKREWQEKIRAFAARVAD